MVRLVDVVNSFRPRNEIDLLTSLKRGLDRASKSGKFMKENKCAALVPGINTAVCGKKLLWVSEHFSEGLLPANLRTVS